MSDRQPQNELSVLGLPDQDVPLRFDETEENQELNSITHLSDATRVEDSSVVPSDSDRSWLARHKGRLAFGLALGSTVLTLTTNPVSEVRKDVVKAAPWVGSGVVASEALFILGAGMMISAVGDKIGNPLKVKERLPEIATKASNSRLFQTGFWINTTGAVGDFVVISAGVLKELPPQSYGVLSITLMDLGVTYAVRKALHNTVRSNTVAMPSDL